MNHEERLLARRGLEFFGRVSASISHEIKNVFAIIGESSGLMEDLLLMHRNRGAPLDPERLKILVERIRKHLNRGDEIVKNMNRFAHSVDEPPKVVDLGELTLLVLTIAGRFAALRGLSLEPSWGEKRVTVETDPFLLQQLLWVCLEFAMSVCGEAKKVLVGLEASSRGADVLFSGLEIPVSTFREHLPPEAGTLMEVLGAELSTDAEGTVLCMGLPGRRQPP